MNSVFITQIVVSFLAGGCFIALLTLLSERASNNVAGIIMMFPSTIILGFLFLGLATSNEKVALIIPTTLIPLGILVFAPVIYIYCSMFFSRCFESKVVQILVTFLTTSLVWFVFAAPFAIWKFTNLTIGVIGYIVLATLAYRILNNVKLTKDLSRRKYTKLEIILRALYTGSIIALVVFLGKVCNPFWGGIFTMFPAATFAALMIFHFYYQPTDLFYFFKKAPIGSLSLFTYAVSVMILFPRYGIMLGTILSCGIAFALSVFLARFTYSSTIVKLRSEND